MDDLNTSDRLRQLRFKAECLRDQSRKALEEEMEEVKKLLRSADTEGLLKEDDYSLPTREFMDKAELALLHYGIEGGEF